VVRFRSIFTALAVAAAVAASTSAHPRDALAAQPEDTVSATLDGRPIPLVDVAKYFCDDFSFPVITCSANAAGIDARASGSLQAAAVDYVTIYDAAGFGGAWMHVSQDYTGLWSIGWNDRISSFKGRNYETGRFWTDWYYGGTYWAFCCNQQVASLGSYDNTFSSILRT
jgi:hypothetical protein